MSTTDRQSSMTAERRRKFNQYYSTGKGAAELKRRGLSVDQAFQGMRREVERREHMDDRNGSLTKPKVSQNAVARKLSSAQQTRVVNGKTQVKTPGRSDWHYPVGDTTQKRNRGLGIKNPLRQSKNPVTGANETPVRRWQRELGNFNKSNQSKLQNLHDQAARTGNPFASKNGKTPLQRMGIGSPPVKRSTINRAQAKKNQRFAS